MRQRDTRGIRDRPAVNTLCAGPRSAYRDIDLGTRGFRCGPSKLKFRGRKGLETGQPEVVDVHAAFPRRLLSSYGAAASQGSAPATLSRQQALISQPATL